MSELEDLRAKVADSCRILARAGLVENVLGHVSARLDGGRMLIRCRGPHEHGLLFTEPADIHVVDWDGDGLPAGSPFRIPNELAIHGELYKRRPEVNAVVHAHPPHALIAGLAELELRPVFGAYNMPAMHLAEEGVPVYPRPVLITRPELAHELIDAMAGKSVCIMRGHGVTVTGESVEQATVRALDLDALTRVTRELAALGRLPDPVSAADRAELPDVGGAINELYVWRYQRALLSRLP